MIEQTAMFPGVGVQTVSRREFAEIVGKSEPLIRKYIGQGKISGDAIVRLPKGNTALNLEVALAQWRSFHPDEVPGDDGEKPSEKDGGAYTEMQSESLRRIRLDNQERELRIAILNRDYLSVDEFRAVFEPMITAAKHKLYQVEDALVARLPGNPVENGRIIRQAIDEICTEIQFIEPKHRKKRGRKTATA